MKKRPMGITVIGYFYIIGAVMLLMSLGTQQDIPFNIRFGVAFLPEMFVRIVVAVFSFIMAYGYLRLTKWGYWMMMIYSAMFLVISLKQMSTQNSQPFIGNAIFSAFVLLYSYSKRNLFVKKSES
jgi:uncharacterized membrane protein (DUF2068 family)